MLKKLHTTGTRENNSSYAKQQAIYDVLQVVVPTSS